MRESSQINQDGGCWNIAFNRELCLCGVAVAWHHLNHRNSYALFSQAALNDIFGIGDPSRRNDTRICISIKLREFLCLEASGALTKGHSELSRNAFSENMQMLRYFFQNVYCNRSLFSWHSQFTNQDSYLLSIQMQDFTSISATDDQFQDNLNCNQFTVIK